MPNARSKKELILEYQRARGLERAGGAEIRAIQAELRRRLGSERNTPPSYIANVLRQAGTRVEYPGDLDDRYVDPAMDEPYASRLEGVLQFHDLASAENAIRKLDAIYREYRTASDRAGASLVRSLALKGKQRAQSLAANPRVKEKKRQEKREIADWFRVWLESPGLFEDWLALRKRSEEFQRRFGDGKQ